MCFFSSGCYFEINLKLKDLNMYLYIAEREICIPYDANLCQKIWDDVNTPRDLGYSKVYTILIPIKK